MYNNILDQIMMTKKEELAAFVMPEIQRKASRHSLKQALLQPNHELGLIAEVKQASPSKGLFRETMDPAAVAESYAGAGADAISVLTDRTYFHGSNENLVKVRQAVNLPVLRKDFIIDERQVEEAARIGADAILLIAAALDPIQLHELYLAAEEKGMESLVEVHRPEEAEAVLHVFTPEIIGVNNRDLKTFETKLEVTASLAGMIPDGVVFVSESGIRSGRDVYYLKHRGVNAALVGESLIRARDVKKKVTELFGREVRTSAPHT
ncbi:indole-3-glycerol phosphate synthase TrpC [Sporolactobacillus sp. THM7-4]|nr:indole-3-glycerol phosphate synthase TrpC [Sporolactobacillus sp. THM7-4]